MPARVATPPELRRAERVSRYREDPVYFGNNILGIHLWSKQREIMRAVWRHRRVAVKACHGPGKTYSAAATVLAFMRLPGARVITTAPTWKQVRNLLWHETRNLHRRSRVPLGGRMLQTEYHLDEERYAIGLSTKPEEVESFQGHHAPNLLVVFDEASGIPQPLFDVAEGYLTTPGARALLIGNPTRPEGEFHAAFTAKRAIYHRITISASDLPAMTGEAVPEDVAARLTSREWVEEKAKVWGVDNPLYQVRVLGEFPRQAEDSVLALGAIEEAQLREREIPPDAERVYGCDVARFGTDETVISERLAHRVRILDVRHGQATTATAGRLQELQRERGPGRVVVDDSGVGGGVTDMCVEAGLNVTPFNGGESPLDPDLYPNARSELWFEAGQQLCESDLDPDDQLAADLAAPRYSLDSRGRRKVEPKETTKKRLGRSPDRGDSALLTYAPDAGPLMEVWD